MRFLLGNLSGWSEEERVEVADMPELEQLMLHRLSVLDEYVRRAYEGYEFYRVFHTLFNFATTELSAFYFDIRKDSLYCDRPDDIRRRACRTVLDEIFRRLTTWFAPVMVFTMEEVWHSRFGENVSSIHLEDFPETPSNWSNEALAEKWDKIREVRKVVTGALEIERREKRIGSSLEANPTIFISDDALLAALDGQDMAEIAITSQISITSAGAPDGAFQLPDVPGVAVVPGMAEGNKCQRSWKILPEVGSDPDFPDLTSRDADAVRWLKSEGRI